MNVSHNALSQTFITVKGIVQGVGFRPYVYRLAHDLELTGSVLNDHKGVEILIQGETKSIDRFIKTLQTSPPPLARIDELIITPQPFLQSYEQFIILESDKGDSQAIVAVSADKSTCQDCLDEMNDPQNRHYQYPFTNCTNCGPRYTIINHLPYDRHLTSMAHFSMCAECEKAYKDPLDRRYHAQPVSCPHCGPVLSLYIGEQLTNTAPKDVIQHTAKLLEKGYIIALKGLGGFHLICDATNETAVATLRQRKQRPAKPLAVMMQTLEQAKMVARGSEKEWQVLSSPERPITLLYKDSEANSSTLSLAKSVAPHIDRVGLFLPYTPLHHLLLDAFKKPIVATSANRSGEPIISDISGIKQGLMDVVDAIVDHNRPIANACDDSVVQVVNGQLQVLRLARGYAPLTLSHGLDCKTIQPTLAVGAQQKNTIALAFNRNMILSPHIGDLFSIEAERYFEDNLATFKRLYQFTPDKIISDNHPDYAPSRWAKQYHLQQQVKHQSIQHHYAHILSVMATNQYTEKVIGVSFDGTGLGDNGELWGSEVMLADVNGYQTLAHFSPFKLIGGEQAIKHPVRILLSLLFESFSLDEVSNLPIKAIQNIPSSMLVNLHKLWLNSSYGLYCRSVGRLFDALAVALNLIDTNQFEGQAGMMVEAQAACWTKAQHSECQHANIHPAMPPMEISTKVINGVTVWQSHELFKQIIQIIGNHSLPTALKTAYICHQFMQSIALATDEVTKACVNYPIVFTGGVFQNRHLLTQSMLLASTRNHSVLPSGYVPINDAGIALGQLWYGLHQNSN